MGIVFECGDLQLLRRVKHSSQQRRENHAPLRAHCQHTIIAMYAWLPLHKLDRGPDADVSVRPGKPHPIDQLIGLDLDVAQQADPGCPILFLAPLTGGLAHVQLVHLLKGCLDMALKHSAAV